MRHPPEAAGSDAVLVASASVTGSPPRETDERAFLVEDATMFASASQPARTRSHAAFTKLALEAAATEPAPEDPIVANDPFAAIAPAPPGAVTPVAAPRECEPRPAPLAETLEQQLDRLGVAVERFAVDSSGEPCLLELPAKCDACPHCDDVCALPHCVPCAAKRERRGALPTARTPAPGGASWTLLTPCVVRRQRTLGRCWVVADRTVYDATPFLAHHPGGRASLMRRAGRLEDCSRDLDFHSPRARKLWKRLAIGRLAPCSACGPCCGGAPPEQPGAGCALS